jgi:DNA repair photolyase
VKASVFFGPVYPTISKKDVPQILDTFIKCGVSEIMIDDLNLKPGVWSSIKKSIVNNHKLYKVFSEKIYRNAKDYNNIREEIMRMGKKRGIKIIDAF